MQVRRSGAGTTPFVATGAYGFTMASQYNGRALPDELFVVNGQVVAVLRGRTSAEWAASRFPDAGP